MAKGYVDIEQLSKLQRCLVGESISFCDSKSINERLAKLGLREIFVKRIQGKLFLVEIPDE